MRAYFLDHNKKNNVYLLKTPVVYFNEVCKGRLQKKKAQTWDIVPSSATPSPPL